MTTGLQLAILAGALVALGITLVVLRFVPAPADLGDVVERYSAGFQVEGWQLPPGASATDKLGVWATKHLPAAWWGQVPTKELAIMQMPLHRFYGKKATHALAGLVIPPLLAFFSTVVGLQLPLFIPVGGSIFLAVFLWFVPDLDIRAEAKKARSEFSRALGAYIDLVALERLAGAGARQAMEAAAVIGDSWVFKRIGEELARSRWSGLPPWDALHALADELGLPELEDVADIMRLSKDGTQVYENLRARADALSAAQISDELAKANSAAERMSMPMSALGVVFMIILIVPTLLRLMIGG